MTEDFIPMPEDFDNIEEPQPAPEGFYTLRAISVKNKNNDGSPAKTKNGELMFRVAHEIVDRPDAPHVWHNVMIPKGASAQFTKLMFKRYVTCFNIDPHSIDPEGMCFQGNEAGCKLKYIAADLEQGYPAKNELVLPELTAAQTA